MAPRSKGKSPFHPYTREVANAILDRMSAGETIKHICSDSDMPSAPTVRRWVVDDVDGFAAEHERAVKVRCEFWADEILDIADDGANDYKLNAKGNPVPDQEVISRSHLRISSRKWLMAQLSPSKFSDKQTVEHANSATAPLQVTVRSFGGSTIDTANATDATPASGTGGKSRAIAGRKDG